jgi:8-amino-7-oxononanoate synthase
MLEKQPTEAASPLDWIEGELSTLEAAHVRRQLVDRASRQEVRVIVDGQELLNFASNDYLGLAADPRLAAAALAAVEHFGWGAGASPLITGHSALHRQLEKKLARFEHTEAALLYPTGYAANVGVITALVGKGDHVFSDANNHASIIDGCRLSGATTHVYKHCHAEQLEQALTETPDQGKRLIVTDGLFSMDGDVAPLADLAKLATSHHAMLMVDEAHATGVLGMTGRGTSELCNVESTTHIRVGTLSKGLGTLGGFATGSQPLIDWLVNRSRPYIFSTAAPAAVAAAGLAALEIVQTEPERRERLQQLATQLRTELDAAGLNTGLSTTHIIPVILGDPQRTMDVSRRLKERGFLVPGIRPPSVPAGESLLRISLSAAHTPEMLSNLVHTLKQALAP